MPCFASSVRCGLVRAVASVSLAAFTVLSFVGSTAWGQADAPPKPLRVGIIGLDTSHVVAFTKLLNRPNNTGPMAGVTVVAAYPGGSPDIPASADRVQKFTDTLREEFKIEIVDSIDALLTKVDVVLLESVDGRPHLEQVRPVLAAGKPVFIDKPVAGSLADAVEIFDLAKKHNTPCFSSSSIRFGSEFQNARNNPAIGDVLGCEVYSPCSLEPHHPDLFWYGVHGVEGLFTVMGQGCETVTRVHSPDVDLVVGLWKDGRVGTFRGLRKGKTGYGGLIYGSKGIVPSGKYEGYEPLLVEICKFFRTGVPPVSPAETLELFSFMEAADESKRLGGSPVSVSSTLNRARSLVSSRTRAPE